MKVLVLVHIHLVLGKNFYIHCKSICLGFFFLFKKFLSSRVHFLVFMSLSVCVCMHVCVH